MGSRVMQEKWVQKFSLFKKSQRTAANIHRPQYGGCLWKIWSLSRYILWCCVAELVGQ